MGFFFSEWSIGARSKQHYKRPDVITWENQRLGYRLTEYFLLLRWSPSLHICNILIYKPVLLYNPQSLVSRCMISVDNNPNFVPYPRLERTLCSNSDRIRFTRSDLSASFCGFAWQCSKYLSHQTLYFCYPTSPNKPVRRNLSRPATQYRTASTNAST